MTVRGEEIYDLHLKVIYVYKRETTPEWKFNDKNIKFHNLIYVYGGSGSFGCNGEVRTVKSGDLVFLPYGCDRWMKTDSNNLLRLYTVNFKAALPKEENGKWTIEAADFLFEFVRTIEDEAARKRFEVLFERLCLLYMTGQAVRKIKQRAALAEILELAELCRKNQSVSYNSRNIVNKSVEFMTEHYYEKQTLERLAKEAGLSASHYSAVFKKVTGKSPIEYLIHLRIFRAKQLLADGFSVTATAEAVGFSDIYYFSNMFKKIEGVSPTKYINERKETLN